MGEELNLDDIYSGEELANLGIEETVDTKDKELQDTKEEKEIKDTTEDVDANALFDEKDENNEDKAIPESVSSGKEDKQGKEDTTDKGGSSSPQKQNFYSSIATAFAEEGIFPDLDTDEINKVTTPESFRELIDKKINSMMEERTLRVEKLLNGGVEPNVINQYENTISYLNKIDDDSLSSEDEDGEKLRKNLIYQDYVNRGYSQERASKMVTQAIEKGTDIEDAKTALDNCKDFYESQYKKLQDEAKQNEEKAINERKKVADNLKKEIFESKTLIGDADVDKATRQKIYDFMSKPTNKDANGNYMTDMQKFFAENNIEAQKNFAICYVLTNGFKDWNKLGSKQAKKAIKKGFKNLENVINSSNKNSGGGINFLGGDEGNSLSDDGYILDDRF